jgi:hypothetical protein
MFRLPERAHSAARRQLQRMLRVCCARERGYLDCRHAAQNIDLLGENDCMVELLGKVLPQLGQDALDLEAPRRPADRGG